MQHLMTAALLSAATLSAQQGRNVRVLSRSDLSNNYLSEVWGYVSPAGKEYAVVGSITGTYVLDCSDPARPVQRGFIPHSASGWRNLRWSDVKIYRHYAYVATEGGGGMQIIDLQDPDKPKLLKTWTTTGWSNTHNLGFDPNGFLYTCGAGGGMRVLDIKTDPVNPRLVANYTANYVHDLYVKDGIAHVLEYYARTYRLMDVSKLPLMRTLGTGTVWSAHNAWPTRDHAYAVTTSERAGGALTVFDIKNKSAPRQIATYRTGLATTSVHNAYIKNRVVHMSYYSEGLRVVDLSDPARPVEVGYYDTSTATTGFIGAWGCYPLQPSGVVYLTNRPIGFYIFESKAQVGLYGSGTSGTGGQTPAAHAHGAPYLGNVGFALEVENARPRSPSLLLLGAKGNLRLGGLTLLVDLGQSPIVLLGATDAGGRSVVPLGIPNAAPLKGAVVHAQFLVIDSGGSSNLAATRGMRFELFSL